MKRLVSALLLGAVVLLQLGATPAQAAGRLQFSDPEEHAELSRAPGWVSLVFDTEVDESLAKLVVLNSAGENVTVDALIIEGTQITTQLRSGLAEGTYTVLYRVGGEDGEPVGGSYQFAYGKGSWTPDGKTSWTGEENQPPVIADPNPNPTAAPTGQPTTSAAPSSGASTTAPPSAAPSSPGASAGSTPSPAPINAGGTGNPWLWVAIAAVVAAAGGAVALVLRRRSRGGQLPRAGA